MRQNYSLRQQHHNLTTRTDKRRIILLRQQMTPQIHSLSCTRLEWFHRPFAQRAGCPRQGTLAPHVKSLLVLHADLSPQVLDGILAVFPCVDCISISLKSTKQGQEYVVVATINSPQVYGQQGSSRHELMAKRWEYLRHEHLIDPIQWDCPLACWKMSLHVYWKEEETNMSRVARTWFGRRHSGIRYQTVCSMGSNWIQWSTVVVTIQMIWRYEWHN